MLLHFQGVDLFVRGALQHFATGVFFFNMCDPVLHLLHCLGQLKQRSLSLYLILTLIHILIHI